RGLVDVTVGSTLRAMLEASASVGLWIQWLIVQVLQTTRAATSAGGDLDSWVGDFGVARLPAVAARGVVTFGRYSAAAPVTIPAGTQLRSADGALLFAVLADATMAAGIASLDVPAAAVVAGAAGNVQASAISLIAAVLPGVDTVTNAAAFQGGIDAESDDALRARFALFLDSRTRATGSAIAYAVGGVQQGLRHALLENRMADGTPMMGSFVVVVDDGSGAPSPSLLSAVGDAVEAIRPIGTVHAVQAPTVLPVTVALGVDVADGANAGAVRDAVFAAAASYVDGLGLGESVVWSRLFQAAYAASPFVTRVGAASLNGGTVDIPVGPASVAKTASVVVS
ncbi:MAG: baseplate J/gp47 family protein, partial [Alphaproteobacteria bacterium]|nr:baseplate J/gp47 family protein [Alphaproteobacteria bacterium]